MSRLARMKMQEHRVDVLRVLDEQRRAGVHALHVEHADDDRGDRVAGDAEHQRRNPGAGQRASCWPRPTRRCLRRGRCRTSPAPSRISCSSRSDIQAAMSAPAPGSAPISVPSALPRRICSRYAWPAPTCRRRCCRPAGRPPLPPARAVSTAKRRISEIANMPIIIGIRLMPPSSSVLPKVKRG